MGNCVGKKSASGASNAVSINHAGMGNARGLTKSKLVARKTI